jgi:hypothetical protein
MISKFPRKEIYVCTLKNPLGKGKVLAVEDRKIKLDNSFKDYSERKWEAENKGWTNSVTPSAVNVETKEDRLLVHCGLTEYKYLLGLIKLSAERGWVDSVTSIQGLNTEIMPLTTDGIFVLSRRAESTTQHGSGFYDIPSAGHNAQMWLNKVPKEKSYLVSGLLDMIGFPKWNLMRNLGLVEKEIGEVFYTGFSKGFEISLDTQFNGYTQIGLSANELHDKAGNENNLFYRIEDIIEILSSINNDGKIKKIKGDIYGRFPEPTENGFELVDDCIGTLLSNLKHLRGEEKYLEALEILKNKGYLIKEISEGIVNLNDLK